MKARTSDTFAQPRLVAASDAGLPATPAAMALSDEQYRFWDDNGYLVLKGALDPDQVREILAMVDAEWTEREGNDHLVDILSGEDAWKSFQLNEARPEHRREVYKLNNLFLRRERLRRIALAPVIKDALHGILGGEPLICNSLNFERGSQQPFHLDTWYMPPPVEGMMVAANIALEPMTPDNGPFIYYPGSHKIPVWRFSHGLLNIIEDEREACEAYLNAEVERRGLKAETFSCEAGDVFLWHAQLYHGGSPIRDMSQTRNSLVIHYWRSQDLPAEMVRTDASGDYLAHTLRGEIAA